MAGDKKPFRSIPAIVGPTAVGKTDLAFKLAERHNIEVVSADSMLVYRYMDVGTAKPTREQRERLRHHVVDVIYPDETYDAARFARDAWAAIEDVYKRGKTPVIVGGTGLYIKALERGLFNGPAADRTLRGELEEIVKEKGVEYLHRELAKIDPVSAARIHPRDKVRIIRAIEVYRLTGRPISEWQKRHGFREARVKMLKIGLITERDRLKRRVEERTEKMFRGGLIRETRWLLKEGYDRSLPSMQGFTYKNVCRLLDGEIDISEARRLIVRDTLRLAKRQLTWFRKDRDILWFRVDSDIKNVLRTLDEALSGRGERGRS